DINQIKEIQQSEPGYAADKMQPTKQHQEVSVEIGGEVDVGQVQSSLLKVCSGRDDCRWRAREMKPGRSSRVASPNPSTAGCGRRTNPANILSGGKLKSARQGRIVGANRELPPITLPELMAQHRTTKGDRQ